MIRAFKVNPISSVWYLLLWSPCPSCPGPPQAERAGHLLQLESWGQAGVQEEGQGQDDCEHALAPCLLRLLLQVKQEKEKLPHDPDFVLANLKMANFRRIGGRSRRRQEEQARSRRRAVNQQRFRQVGTRTRCAEVARF